MTNRCSKTWESLVNSTSAVHDLEVLAHLEQCAECRTKAEQLAKVEKPLKLEFFDAPADLISRVQDFMPQRKLSFKLRLVSSSLSAAGARSAQPQDFQAVYEAEGVQARVLYAQTGKEWEVVGKVSGEGWSAVSGKRKVRVDESGRFSFKAKDLAHTEILLSKEDTEVVIPSASEASAGDA